MKKLLLILCLSSILPLLGQTTPNRSVVGWEKLPTGTNSDLADVCCLDAEIIIVTTNDGKILKTIDGGLTWSTKYQHDNRIIRSLKFTENNVGYCLDCLDAFNNNPALLRTTDGGDDWSVVSEFDELSYNASLFPVDADTLYVYDDRRFMLMKSTDGGVTFEDVGLVIGDLFEPYDMFFEDNVGYFAGQNFVLYENGFTIYKTVDYGASWLTVLTLKDVPGFSNPWVYHIKAYFWDKDRVQLYFMASSDTYDGAFLLETSDGFETYTVTCGDLVGTVTAIKFINGQQGCCVVEPEIPLKEYSSMVGVTEDAGYQWKGVMEGIKKDAEIFAMDGADPYFYLASNDGILYKSILDNPEWYYEIQNPNGSVTYQHLEYASDTSVNSHRAKVLIRTNTLYDKDLHVQASHEYIYEQNDTVYWWNKALGEFTMLYDFGAETGDDWTIYVAAESFIMHVDSIGSMEYEEYTYRVLHVSDADDFFTGDIVCGIGHLSSFFPERLMETLHPDALYSVDGLRCYWQDGHLFLKFGNDDCDAIYNGIHEVSEDTTNSFMVYPNPTKGTLVINYSAFRIPHSAFHITNLLGQTVLSGSFDDEGRRHDMTSLQVIDVSSLSPGIYIITLNGCTQKLIIQ